MYLRAVGKMHQILDLDIGTQVPHHDFGCHQNSVCFFEAKLETLVKALQGQQSTLPMQCCPCCPVLFCVTCSDYEVLQCFV